MPVDPATAPPVTVGVPVKNFLKSPIRQHRDPEARLGALGDHDPSDAAGSAALVAAARTDDDERVRLGAVERLGDGAALLGLYADAPELMATAAPADAERAAAALRDAAFARLAALLEGGDPALDTTTLARTLDLDAPRFAPLVAARSNDAGLRARALDAIDDEAGFVRVVQGAGFHEARLGAAERLHTHDGLRQALHASRSRDKVVARVLQQKLDAEAEAESARIGALHAVSATLDGMRQLAASVWSPQHEGRARALSERWAGLDEGLRADHEAEFGDAHAKARAAIEEHARARGPQAPADSAEPAGGVPDSAGSHGDGRDADGEATDGGSGPDPDAAGTTGVEGGRSDADPADDPAGTPEEGVAAVAPPPPLDMDEPARVTLERLRDATLVLPGTTDEGAGTRPKRARRRRRRDRSEGSADGADAASGASADESDPESGARPAEMSGTPSEGRSADAGSASDPVAGTEPTAAADASAASPDAGGVDAVAVAAPASSEVHDAPGVSVTADAPVAADASDVADATDAIGASAEPDATTAPDAAQPPPVDAEPLAAALDRLQSDPVPGDDGSAAARALRQYAAAVAVLFDPPFALQGARPGVVRQRHERIGALLDTDALLPGVPLDGVRWLDELRGHRDTLAHRLDQSTQESADRLRATQRQFGALSGLVKEGKYAPATSLLRRLKKKVEGMEPAERREIADRLSRAEKQIADLGDWQDFAAKPKLEELVTNVHALAQATDVSPEARLQKLRAMQAEWKTLGASRASNELWPRFKEASDAAYEPARAFFEERAKEREGQATKRLELVEELEASAGEASGDAPDLRAVQRRVSDARKLWSDTRVRDRKPDRALEKRFTEALRPFEAATAGEFEKNAVERRALVERMEALAEGEITQHAANQAKSLQAAWKLVGPVPRKDDQKLWDAFRAAGTLVFDARRSATAEQRKAELGHVFRGREIVDELKKLGRRDAVDEAEVAKLTGEFEALPEFPERDRNGLRKAYEGALSGLSKQRETAQRRRREAGLEEARRLVGLCERIEYALEDGNEPGDPLALREDVMDAWTQGSDIDAPREVAAPLEARRDAALAHLTAGTAPDWAASEKLRRDLLIRMEVAADVDTPPEDKSRRMRFQLANLQAGMTGGAVLDRRTQLAELEREWLAAPPVRSAVRDSLHSRYLAATGR